MQIKTFDQYEKEYAESINNPALFWEKQAKTFIWKKKWNTVLDWEFDTPRMSWFKGGKLNITENCLDRHLQTHPNKTAIIWEPNNPADKAVTYSYKELYEKVCQLAHVLKNKGVKKGDRVCIYMPMVVELSVAVLACARIGAVHSVVFAGFSAKALADRIEDAECKLVLTADGVYRGAKKIRLKDIVDKAVDMCSCVQAVLVLRHIDENISMQEDRDTWWQEEIANQPRDCPAEIMDAEDMLFILYTSGSTGKPKGVVHTCGGYMVYVQYSFENVFQYQEKDVYWCTADIGWITGHSYIVYGPLLAGATSLMFEGIPTYPDAGRFWQICEKHQVNIFYTAPTAIRSLMAQGVAYVQPYELSSLKTLGTVGEPINQEAWEWYYDYVGKGKCAIVDTWWQTETGGVMIAPLAHITPTKPTLATFPLPGVQPILVDKNGVELEGNDVEGLLCIKFPWPSMIRTTYGNHKRCKEVYFSAFPNRYFTGDGARRDAQGMYRIIGRVDDVINVSGHRIGTAEVENAINQHTSVVESAVVCFPHNIKGEGICAYVICHQSVETNKALEQGIRTVVNAEIGAIAKPDKIVWVEALPKTRSGKIMRRLLRKIARGDTADLGDTSTLLNPDIVELLIEKMREE